MESSRIADLVTALKQKGVSEPCPRCTGRNFSIVGETALSINESPGVLVVGGPAVPAVIVACDRCGYLSLHSQIALGVLRKSSGNA